MVIGILILLGLLVYLLVSTGVVIWAVRYARQHDKAGWKWGLSAALLMYLLLFWDWIPTAVMYRHDCTTRAGFTVFKTLDEWKRKNPGVAETLVAIRNAPREVSGNRVRHPLNQRFAWDIVTTRHPLSIREREERIVDTKTGEVLARYIDFYTDFTTRTEVRNFHDLKVWMSWRSCENPELPEQIMFNGYQQSVELLGGNSNEHK